MRIAFSNFYSQSRQKISIQDKIKQVPNLFDFMQNQQENPRQNTKSIDSIPFYIETYGCQMNVSDSEIVQQVLKDSNFQQVNEVDQAKIVLLNTCAIRENAETTIWNRLKHFKREQYKSYKNKKIVGVLGCMAERLKQQLIEKEKVVDLVAGPDSYRQLPNMLESLLDNDKDYQSQVNVQLSLEETYADIIPVRQQNEYHAFISIMRGCNNMCSYCIVPFTRGRERSRDVNSIIKEAKILEQQGVKEITLLGQNVNSYFHQINNDKEVKKQISEGFFEMYKLRDGDGQRFADLIEILANETPNLRYRYTSPHPKDFPDQLLNTMAKYPNICKHIHIPAQSGNTEVLFRMRRNHTADSYYQLIDKIRNIMPNIALSSDHIVGFCGETEQEFEDTLQLVDKVQYDMSYNFAYSLREKTHAHRSKQLKDDVSEQVKQQRLRKLIDKVQAIQKAKNQNEVGRTHICLIEGNSKKKKLNQYRCRTDTNKTVVIDKEQCKFKPGDFVSIEITNSSSGTLQGKVLDKTTIQEFAKFSNNQPFILKE